MVNEDRFPMTIYLVTGLRSTGWLFANTGPMKLALKRRAYWGVKIWRQDVDHSAAWHNVTDEFLDENGKPKW
ncbi:hypothetical protein [Nonomuraea typhae]|uniref:DUF3291 domain-containing protein n=1 Tax=Nonomuraea typhae TaxID=2603600 RepID=A0ABW7YJW2_9ACTN